MAKKSPKANETMDFDSRLSELHGKTLARVNRSLKDINIALKLNIAKQKARPMPPDIARLVKWRDALDYWKDVHGSPPEDPEAIAESLGVFYEICRELE